MACRFNSSKVKPVSASSASAKRLKSWTPLQDKLYNAIDPDKDSNIRIALYKFFETCNKMANTDMIFDFELTLLADNPKKYSEWLKMSPTKILAEIKANPEKYMKHDTLGAKKVYLLNAYPNYPREADIAKLKATWGRPSAKRKSTKSTKPRTSNKRASKRVSSKSTKKSARK